MEKPVMKASQEDTPETRAAEEWHQRSIADAQLRDRLMAEDKYRRTHLQLLYDAEQNGKAEGKAEGITLGQHEQRREIALKLKAKGMPPEEIAEIIDLPLEEIQGL